MPTTIDLRNRLVGKLKELFQLDQPDLDFGFYRIMHAKAKQVTEFIEKDLLQVIEDTFGNQADQQSAATLANARRELEEALGADALDENGLLKESFGALPAGKRYLEALAKAAAAKDALSAEGEIYDHLHRFFERYYEDGDFISRRYFSRETAGRAAPFAIPYNGEEVKLHWANADQYYIKTGEYFSNFTIDLTKAPEAPEEMKLESTDSLPVHFRVVDAAESEHGNVKATDATKRFFILHADNPVGFDEKGELEIRFEYRPDPDKPEKSQEAKWQEELRSQAVESVLEKLATIPETAIYRKVLAAKAPSEANKDRTLLAKYLYQYTARNTSDYFIHKDLGSFLRRELDFYIKNEVMRLDDIENEDAPRVESYLAKLKVLRTISRQLIDFLAQLENFQKKLWLKKKFVTETNYGITLDRIPEELYPEIADNDSQREEWVKLYAIDEIEGKTSDDLLQAAMPGYSSPLTIDFLKSQPYLVLDTRYFSEDFQAKLVASIENFEQQCNGLLIHADNFQGVSFLEQKYRSDVAAGYYDPPYNTGTDGFTYKDSFPHSSWLTMFASRLAITWQILKKDSVLFVSLDDNEMANATHCLLSTNPSGKHLATFARRTKSGGGSAADAFAVEHDYVLAWSASDKPRKFFIEHDSEYLKRYSESDGEGPFFWDTMERSATATKPYMIEAPDGSMLTGRWFRSESRFLEDLAKGDARIIKVSGGGWSVQFKQRLADGRKLRSLMHENEYKSQPEDLNELNLGNFSYPKSVHLVRRLIESATFTDKNDSTIIDIFAGSGTTAHALIKLNRHDKGSRKYILIEMGDHFDTVLKPRIAKVVYSPDWKDGKPTSRDNGISHCFKYLRLESYEDTLNNLRFVENSERNSALSANAPLRRDYTLNYLLDVDTRGSQSLLNIAAFTNPVGYTMKVKKPGASGSVEQAVDLIETFNFLIGLRVVHLAAPQRFSAKFKRVPDPDLPKGTDTRLQLDGKMKQSADGAWWFRKVEGWVPKDRENPNNGQKEKILIVWRTLTGNLEEDNLMLDEWFQKNRLSTRDFEFDTIYVNGSNNLPNLKLDSDTWKVRLLEEEFHKAMWDVQDV
jgi:adenine-specific DNA-methyltransferase